MSLGFEELLLVVGVLLTVAAALSGLFQGTVLSISVLGVTAGIGLALAGVVQVDPSSKDILHVIELALVFTLFSDGLVADRELVRRHWHPPARALVAAMPMTFALIALGAHFLFPALTWPEAFLLAAVLSPTDPVVTFFLFGALIVVTGFQGSILALVAFIVVTLLVARPLAILLSFARSRLDRPERLFVAWFGPKGVASMLFALFVLSSQAPDRTLVFDVAAFVILASIAAHGLTDTVGARWIERRMAPVQE